MNTTGQNLQQIKIWDVILVHDKRPHVNWILAVITKLLVGRDGLIRAAEICTNTGTMNQPINKLFPLEINSTSEYIQHEPEPQAEVTRPSSTQPLRQSAIKATDKMSKWIEIFRAPPEDGYIGIIC